MLKFYLAHGVVPSTRAESTSFHTGLQILQYGCVHRARAIMGGPLFQGEQRRPGPHKVGNHQREEGWECVNSLRES